MIKAKIKIDSVEHREAMLTLCNLKILPTKISEDKWSAITTFWITVANDEELFTALTHLNKFCPYGGAFILKKKIIKSKIL